MAIKMTPNKFVNLSFSCGMQVLELVHNLELDNIEAVRKNAIWLPFKVLRPIRRDTRYGGIDINTACCGAFHTIPVVNTALSCLVIHIKILEVV